MSARQVILVVLATVVIFAAGVVTGGLLVKKLIPVSSSAQPFFNRFEMAHRAVNQLDLGPEQRLRIHRIIRNKQELIADYFKILEPDVQDLFRQMRKQISEELTPAQRQQLEELMKQRFNRSFPNRPDNFRPGPFAPSNVDVSKSPSSSNNLRSFRPKGAEPRPSAPPAGSDENK